MIFDEFVSAIAEMFAPIAEPIERAVKAFEELGKMSSDDLFFEGYTPMEYAQRKCKREIIREVYRPAWCEIFSYIPRPRSVPGMIRKKGRWVKRGSGII